jgi:spore germination cell wall hydrolase CwlJ-like protein
MTRVALLKFLEPLPDEAILALTLYGEARGEPIEGIIAVGCVIRNRVNDAKQRWPKTYRGVCLQNFQFSVWNVAGADANHEMLMKVAAALKAKEPMSAVFEQVAFCAIGIVRGAILDNTKKSTHYHEQSMKPRPKWAQAYVPVVQIKGHLFYAI